MHALRHGAAQTPRTLVDAVRALADERTRGFVFVRADGTERLVTFHDIGIEATRRGASLAARGLKKGDRVALVIPDNDEFVLSFLGALFAGIVPVPLVPQLSFKNVENYHATVAHIVRASGATMLLTTAATQTYVQPALAHVDTLRSIVTVEQWADDAASVVEADVAPDDVAFLQFTSGSTSRPKGVAVTHANLAANSAAFMIEGLARDSRTDKGVSWLPLFHDMGLIGFVVGPLFTNVACVFLPTASFIRTPRLWLEKLHVHRGTITYAPNFAYALVAKRLKDKDVEGLDLSALRVAGCGAEPIQPKALRDFAGKLAPAGFDPRAFLPSYGMAEATLAITFAPLGTGLCTDPVDPTALASRDALPSRTDGAVEMVDCGSAFAGHEVAIVDPSGHRLAERKVGEIVTRGPSVTAGYFQDPESTAQAFKALADDRPGQAPWLFTGDLGYLTGDRLFVCGRIKDVIIVRGRNYYPTDIEWAVGQIHTVRRGNVVAFGVFVDSRGRPAADGGGEEHLVVCCEGTGSEAEAIRDAANATVAAQFGLTPHEVVVAQLASLPRTSSGKPQRRKARQMYLEGTLPRARVVQGTEPDRGGVEPQ
ncbi:MAG: fatty acyl-AMP ligase [Polyangiaceae bacterium]|jgi:fatty-acyl-CoA synthase